MAMAKCTLPARMGGNTEKGQVWRYISGKRSTEKVALIEFVEPNEQKRTRKSTSPYSATATYSCEDGDGTNHIVGLPQGKLYQFARNATNGPVKPAFARWQDYVLNIQNCITFAIWGPWVQSLSSSQFDKCASVDNC